MRTRTLSATAAVVALVSASVVSAAEQYTATSLWGLGGSAGSKGAAIGPTGLVAGTSYVAGNRELRGLTFEETTGVVTLSPYGPLPSGSNSYGMGIGGVGGETIVGFSQAAGLSVHAISGVDGEVTDLHETAIVTSPGFGASLNSRAFGINGSGAVVGHAKVGNHYQAFFLPAGGPAVGIGALHGQTEGVATAVNDGGKVVGFSYTGSWGYHLEGSLASGTVAPRAWAWQGGSLTDLGTLGGTSSIATSVNGSGVVVGQSTLLASDSLISSGRAFMYDHGVMTKLNELPGTLMSVANDVNDLGLIVGSAKLASGQRAFVYSNGVMTDLNSLLTPASGWVLREATSVNNDGYITGWGTYGGYTTAFLLSPVAQATIPEPASAGLLALGAIVIGGWRRR